MTNNVKRAYFYAPVAGDIFVELPPEDCSEEDKACDRVGKPNLSLYGTREAAAAWQATVSAHLQDIGFRPSLVNPCVYSHEARDIQVLVHGDDYASAGSARDLHWFKQ